MALTDLQVAQLNKMNVAAQRASLGTLLASLESCTPTSIIVYDDYTIDDETIVLTDGVSGSIIITLPDADENSNKVYTIKCVEATNRTSVVVGSGDTIDSGSSVNLALNDALKVVSGSANSWFII